MSQAATSEDVKNFCARVLPRYKYATTLDVRTGKKYHKIVADGGSVYLDTSHDLRDSSDTTRLN